MSNAPPRPTGKMLDIFGNFQTAWRLIRDPSVPLWTKGVPLAALAYVLWPLDILADVVPGLGQLDDLAVILVGLKLFIALSSSGWGKHEQEPSVWAESDDVIDTTYRVLEDPADDSEARF